jgi:hypothetical protein
VRLNPFGSRSTGNAPHAAHAGDSKAGDSKAGASQAAAAPGAVIAARARAAQARESADARRSARRSGHAAREAILRAVDENDRDLDEALEALSRFDDSTLTLMADELDAADPITQWSTLGRSPVVDAGLPGWLRDRCLAPDCERVVLDWIAFGHVFTAHREFSARTVDDPLPQLYEALSLQPGESITVEGVATVGRQRCERILHVAFAVRSAQRAATTRVIRSLGGYAAADAWHAFDRSNRFMTADLAEWLVTDDPSPESISAAIAAGQFSTAEFTPSGRSTGVSPHDIDEAAFVADLRRASGG